MSLTLLHQPDEIAGVFNPIAFEFLTADPMVALEIEMEYGLYRDDSFEQFDFLTVLESPINQEGKAVFYLEDVLKSRLQYSIPDYNQNTPFLSHAQCLRYKVKAATLTDQSSLSTVTFQDIGTYFAFLGGYPAQFFPLRTSALPWDGSGLLKHKPSIRLLAEQQSDWLLYMPQADENLSLSITIHYTDSSTKAINYTVGDIEKYRPTFIPIGMNAHAYQESGKTIDYVSWDELNVQLRFYDAQQWQTAHEFHFFTHSGAFESVFCTGLHQEKVEDKALDFRHVLLYDYTSTDREIQHYNQERKEGGTVNTGFFPDETSFLAASEIYRKLPCYKVVNGNYFPINLKTDTHNRLQNIDPLQGFNFEYEFAFIN